MVDSSLSSLLPHPLLSCACTACFLEQSNGDRVLKNPQSTQFDARVIIRFDAVRVTADVP